MSHDTAFQMSASNIRCSQGVTREIGADLAELDARRTMLVIDPALVELPVGQTVIESLRDHRIELELYDRIDVEPTDVSFQQAAPGATQRRERFEISLFRS